MQGCSLKESSSVMRNVLLFSLVVVKEELVSSSGFMVGVANPGTCENIYIWR